MVSAKKPFLKHTYTITPVQSYPMSVKPPECKFPRAKAALAELRKATAEHICSYA